MFLRMNPVNAILQCDTPDLMAQAEALAARFCFTMDVMNNDTALPKLSLTSDGLSLHPAHMKPWKIDFLSAEKNYRHRHGGGLSETIARACGVKKNSARPHILDITAGLGNDAFILASLGCPMTLIERHPVVAALLEDALKRLNGSSHAPNISLYYADAEQILHQFSPDVIYIDPMHPERSKSACVKKDMQILQQWIAPEMHPEKLLTLSLQVAQKRVVLKWPRKAPQMVMADNRKPDIVYEENTVRFEVYLKF